MTLETSLLDEQQANTWEEEEHMQQEENLPRSKRSPFIFVKDGELVVQLVLKDAMHIA